MYYLLKKNSLIFLTISVFISTIIYGSDYYFFKLPYNLFFFIYEVRNNELFFFINFIFNFSFLFLYILRSLDKNNHNSKLILIFYLIFFYNLIFYLAYFINWQHFFSGSIQSSNQNLYFGFINGYFDINKIFYCNLCFFLSLIIILKFNSSNNKLIIKYEYSIKIFLSSLIIIFIIKYIFIKLSFYSKLIFIIDDCIYFLFIVLSISIIYKYGKNHFKTFLIFSCLVILVIFYNYLYTFNILRIHRGQIFIYILSLILFIIYYKFNNSESLKKLFLFSNLAIFITSSILVPYTSYFHLISEIQMYRNLSLVILSIKNNFIDYEGINYFIKLFYDIPPLTGRERGYTSIISDIYNNNSLVTGKSNFNFGVLSEGFIFFGFIGILIIGSLFSLIISFINYFFSKFNNNIFFICCYFHLLTQSYWLYRGGMSLFIRKLYYFSTVYLFTFIIISLISYIFYYQKKIK